jgi:AraC family transcriptional regulator
LTTRSTDAYVHRFQKTLEYIDTHLSDDLSLDRLSRIAAFSKHHFLRQFSELFGLGIYQYVQLNRLKRASYRLAFRQGQSVIDIALESGYDSPESFARAFKKSTGQTPTEFRRQPRWTSWQQTCGVLADLRKNHMKMTHRLSDVKIVDFDATHVGVLEHRGDPALIGNSITQFIAWRKHNHLHPTHSATFNILYGDPANGDPAAFRLDLCASVERETDDEPYGVIRKTIPAGRCAVLRHIGSDDTLGQSISFLYKDWLPQSGEEPGDFPLFLQRVHFYPDVPETEMVLDLHLPLK